MEIKSRKKRILFYCLFFIGVVGISLLVRSCLLRNRSKEVIVSSVGTYELKINKRPFIWPLFLA